MAKNLVSVHNNSATFLKDLILWLVVMVLNVPVFFLVVLVTKSLKYIQHKHPRITATNNGMQL